MLAAQHVPTLIVGANGPFYSDPNVSMLHLGLVRTILLWDRKSFEVNFYLVIFWEALVVSFLLQSSSTKEGAISIENKNACKQWSF